MPVLPSLGAEHADQQFKSSHKPAKGGSSAGSRKEASLQAKSHRVFRTLYCTRKGAGNDIGILTGLDALECFCEVARAHPELVEVWSGGWNSVDKHLLGSLL